MRQVQPVRILADEEIELTNQYTLVMLAICHTTLPITSSTAR